MRVQATHQVYLAGAASPAVSAGGCATDHPQEPQHQRSIGELVPRGNDRWAEL
jgi:hypothetical protein